MDLTPLVEAAQNSALSEWMRTSLKAVAIINALHIMSIVTVFGTILVVDLRLLGYPNVKRSFMRMHHELLRWTWGAFGIAAVTGVLPPADSNATSGSVQRRSSCNVTVCTSRFRAGRSASTHAQSGPR